MYRASACSGVTFSSSSFCHAFRFSFSYRLLDFAMD